MTSAEAESRLFSSPADHGDGDVGGACGPATTTTTGWQQMQRATDVLKLSSPQAKTRQALATAVAAGGCFVNGCLLGYTASAGPQLRRTSKNLYGDIISASLQEISWIASLLLLGCFFGTFLSFFLLEKFGRRSLMGFVSGGLFAASHALVFFAYSVPMIYVGRLLGGLGMGVQVCAAASYISDVTKRDVRGFAGFVGAQLSASLGAGVTMAVGAAAAPQWWALALVGGVATLPAAAAALMWAPESPRWLLSRGREYSAAKSLEWLRGRSEEDVDRELEALKRDIARQRREERSGLSALLSEKGAARPLLVSLVLMFVCAFSGVQAVVLLLGNILASVMRPPDPTSSPALTATSAVAVVGVFLPASSVLSAVVVSRLPSRRRLVSSASAAIAAACLIVLGWCLRVGEDSLAATHRDVLSIARRDENDTGISMTADLARTYALHSPPACVTGWLPVAAASLFVLVSNGGFGTLVWVVVSEMAPGRFRSSLTRAAALSFHLCSFVATKTFVDLSENDTLRMSGAIFVMAGFCILTAVLFPAIVVENRATTRRTTGGPGEGERGEEGGTLFSSIIKKSKK